MRYIAILSFILAIVLVCGCCGTMTIPTSSTTKSNDPVIGVWMSTDTRLSYDFIEFKNDGTFFSEALMGEGKDAMGFYETGTWKKDGNYYVASHTKYGFDKNNLESYSKPIKYEYTIDGDKLTDIDNSLNVYIRYSKNMPSSIPSIVPTLKPITPTPDPARINDPIIGVWIANDTHLYYAYYEFKTDGTYFYEELADDNGNYESGTWVNDGKKYVIYSTKSGWDVNNMMSHNTPYKYEYTIEDGVLTNTENPFDVYTRYSKKMPTPFP